MGITVRPFGEGDRWWASALLFPAGTPERVASRGVLHNPLELPGFIAETGGTPVGHIAYRVDGAECEIVTLSSAVHDRGSGSALIAAVAEAARNAGCKRLWLVTTNDNTRAIRFYQRRGFRLAAAHPGFVDHERLTIKPEIPQKGNDDIPIRDELEFEIDL